MKTRVMFSLNEKTDFIIVNLSSSSTDILSSLDVINWIGKWGDRNMYIRYI